VCGTKNIHRSPIYYREETYSFKHKRKKNRVKHKCFQLRRHDDDMSTDSTHLKGAVFSNITPCAFCSGAKSGLTRISHDHFLLRSVISILAAP
jgi:hypothetical protein